MGDKAEAKQKVVALYALGRDNLNVKLRALGDYLGVPQDDISDVLSLVHALEQNGVSRLPHALFVDCLWILARVREYSPRLSHTKIMDATNTVLGIGIRPRAVWLKDDVVNMVCFIYDCSPSDLPLSRKGRSW